MANFKEALKYVNGEIVYLEDSLQHYTMVDKDKCRASYIREDLKQFTNIKNTLTKAQEMKKALEIIIKKKVLIVHLLKANTLKDYNWYAMSWNELTQEEFELLKEVFYEL